MNVTPWHAFGALEDRCAAFANTCCASPPAEMLMLSPVWSVKVRFDPGQLALSEDVMDPLLVAAVSTSGIGFGLCTLTVAAPEPPGYRSPEIVADTSRVLSAWSVSALLYAVPVPPTSHEASATPPAVNVAMAIPTAKALTWRRPKSRLFRSSAIGGVGPTKESVMPTLSSLEVGHPTSRLGTQKGDTEPRARGILNPSLVVRRLTPPPEGCTY